MVTSPAPSPCATCQEPVVGRFCASCGERKLTPQDEGLGVFLREQLQETFSADGKLWRTCKALFAPGKLTVAYMEGRRGLYVRPVRVFLFTNVVLFLMLSRASGSVVKGPLASHYSDLVFGEVARRMAEARAGAWPGGMDSFADAFNKHSAGLAPTLVIFLIPALAIVLIWNQPRGSGVRHLVLATHAVSAFIATFVILGATLLLGLSATQRLGWIPQDVNSIDPALVPAITILFATYCCVAVRRVYGSRPWVALISGCATATIGFTFAFWLYRTILFCVSLWTLETP